MKSLIKKPAVSPFKFLQRELEQQMKWIVQAENALFKANVCGTARHRNAQWCSHDFIDWEWNEARTGLYTQARERFQWSVNKAHDYWGRLEVKEAEKLLAVPREWVSQTTSKRHAYPTAAQVILFREKRGKAKERDKSPVNQEANSGIN